MATAVAHDGVRLHWEERGDGPPVVLLPYWSLEPRVWGPVTAELEGDHRVIRYDERGTGRSDRTGPYDLETGAADLIAVLEASGSQDAIALGMVDGPNRAVRVAAERADLITRIVAAGSAPLSRRELSHSESMISSDVVVSAFRQQLEKDYRGAVRGLMESANPQMTAEERRDRVAAQIEHVPQEVAAARVEAWAQDEVTSVARDLGDRLVLLFDGRPGGGWFPEAEELRGILRERLPEARLEKVDDGLLSRPDQAAAVIRALTAATPAKADRAIDLESRA